MFQVGQRVKIAVGVRTGEPGRIDQPPVGRKPPPAAYPEPVWVLFDHLPAQFFSAKRLLADTPEVEVDPAQATAHKKASDEQHRLELLGKKTASDEPHKEPLGTGQTAYREQCQEELARRRTVSYQHYKEELLAVPRQDLGKAGVQDPLQHNEPAQMSEEAAQAEKPAKPVRSFRQPSCTRLFPKLWRGLMVARNKAWRKKKP